jgi:hypothetical protein
VARTRARRKFKLIGVLLVGLTAGVVVGLLLVQVLIAN